MRSCGRLYGARAPHGDDDEGEEEQPLVDVSHLSAAMVCLILSRLGLLHHM